MNRLYDRVEQQRLLDDIRFIIIDSNTKNKDVKLEKITRFLKLYHKGEFLYPQAVKRICEIDVDTLEKIFELLAENKLLTKVSIYRCPNCLNVICVTKFNDDKTLNNFDICNRCNKEIKEDISIGYAYKVL